jgi:hypothetical protein
MKVLNFFFLMFFLIISSLSKDGFAEQRPGKAVYETSSELGMKLNEKALKNIEVRTKKIDRITLLSIPIEGLVFFQNHIGVYRLRDGWFKLIKVQVMKKNDSEATIQTSELRSGDEIAIHGADLLRVAELDAFGGEE